MTKISVVTLGGCREPSVNDSSLQPVAQHDKCVIHPNECPYEFVNPQEVDIMIDHRSCNSVSSTPIGHCGGVSMGEKRHCALTRDACKNPDSFIRPSQSMNPGQHANPDGGGCTVLQDRNYFGTKLSKNDGLTRYIGCSGGNIDSNDALDKDNSEGHVCIATIPECRQLAGYGDSVTINLSDPKCDCSQTRTGACFQTDDIASGTGRFNYFCAVTKGVCDEDKGLFYRDVNQLKQYSDIDCRLCDASAVEDYKFAVKLVSTSAAGVIVESLASVFGAALLILLVRYLFFGVRTGVSDESGGSDDGNNFSKQEDGKAFQEDENEELDHEEDVQVHHATYT